MFAARGGFEYYVPPSGGFGDNLYFPNNSAAQLSKTSTTNLITWKATTGFTCEYWVYMSAWPGSINTGVGNHNGTSTNYWSFGPGASGTVEFYYWGTGTKYLKTATNTLALNTWYNIAFVATTTGTSTTMSIYVNGVRQDVQLDNTGSYEQTKTVTNGVVATATPFTMGRYASRYWNGYIDNLRVSNVNRYSGSSYTVATSPFTYDSDTQLLIVPTGSVGATTIPYESVSGNGNMTNASNLVTISSTHANHT
jgi:hypothetical protein